MQVLKFGGSSVANATAMSAVLDIVEAAAAQDRVILVSSAIRGCTDALIAIGRAEDPESQLNRLQDQHLAIIRRLFTGAERLAAIGQCKETFCEIRCLPPVIEAYGEVLSTQILARKLQCDGFSAKWIDSRKIVRTKDGKVDAGRTYDNIRKACSADVQVFVAPGFIASDEQGNTCTLGRGGSDYSAALYAAGIKADKLEIWTDVPGIMTTNPKDVPAARTIPHISYKAAFDLANNGAKVLYAPTVAPARKAGIAINIRNTFTPAHPGTVIDAQGAAGPEWKGITWQASDGDSMLCMVSEGAVKTGAALRRISRTLDDAGIRPCGEIRIEDAHNFFIPVRTAVAKSALKVLHHEFFEERKQTLIDVYIAGKGAVGTALQGLIESSGERIAKSGRALRIAGISSDHGFVDTVLEHPTRQSVFVDCTNSEEIYRQYVPLLEAGVHIVSSNRRSLSVPYVEYAAMKEAALRNGCNLRYDTTVGTALPILEALSGDYEDIEAIEAVVSCTLNHIITGYDGANTESFATLLHKAQEAGLTEHDPRTDLGGRDALRKLLILAREAGVPLEEEDVQITPMLPQDFFDCPLDEFYRKLEASEPSFIQREAELDALNKRQRFVASIERDASAPHGWRAEIKIRLYGEDSPFYWISGTENVIKIRSSHSAPLIIRGAGEGARQAAIGILKNILS